MPSFIESLALPSSNVPITYTDNHPYLKHVSRQCLDCLNHDVQIPYTIYKNEKNKYTILFFHGNGEDIGKYNVENISKLFGCNIVVMEYSGYGIHTCRNATEKNICADALAIYKSLIKDENIDPSTLILFGRSIGTGVACYLAHHLSINKEKIAGLILLSPFLSIIKTTTNLPLGWFDIFCNYSLAPNIHFSTLIFHGTNDTIVPYLNGYELSLLFPNLYSFISLKNKSHNDIYFDDIVLIIIEFINKL